MSRKIVAQTINGIRWIVDPERSAGARDLLARIDRMIANGRMVKDVRVKTLYECDAKVSGKTVTLLVKVYRAARGVARLKDLFRRNRAVREMETAIEVASREIETVVPLASGVDRGRGIVVCVKLEDWRGLDFVLRDRSIGPSLRRRIVAGFGRFARRVHDAGVWQDDFDPNNILVGPDRGGERFKLIDFERVTLRGAISWPKRVWGLAKMNRIAGVTSTDRLRFLRHYLAPDLAERWKAYAGRIIRTGEAVLDRDCRRLEGNCVRENRNFGRFQIAQYRGYYRKRRSDRMTSVGLTKEDVSAIVAGGSAAGLTRIACRDVVGRWRAMNVAERLGVVRRAPVDLPVLAVMGNGGDGYILLRAKTLKNA